MRLGRPFQVLRPSGPHAELDSHRAGRPSVLQDEKRTWRMWYAGHDGSTSRVLSAEQRRSEGWARSGVSIGAGLAGSTDSAGVDAPSVVRRPTGFVMAYMGSNGKKTRPHLATSDDGFTWRPSGLVDAAGGRTVGSPCLVVTGEQLWLFHAGESSGASGERPAIFGATSSDGSAWNDVGPVLEADPGERALSDPWVVLREAGLLMLFVSEPEDPDQEPSIGLAMSSDGRTWSRHPEPLDLARRHHDAGVISGPSGYDLGGRHVRIWYSARTEGDTTGECRLWSADLAGAPAPATGSAPASAPASA
jgi:hypothetical protein